MFILFIKKFLYSIPSLIFISILVFSVIRLIPGDPVDFMLGEKGASPEMRAQFEQRLGLDKPAYQQYFVFIKQITQGDFGTSIVSNHSVLSEFFSLFPATLELALAALFLGIILGIPLGTIAAVKPNSWVDRVLVGSSLISYSMSIFWWGLVLILFFSIYLEWTPVAGRIGILYDLPSYTGFMLIDSWFSDDPWGAFKSTLSHIILPAVTLASIPFIYIFRMTRSSMQEVLKEDFIRTAKAKGLSFSKVLFYHALRNAFLPIITVIGYMFGSLITGAVLTETVFSWPGIGQWLVQAVLARDYPVLQAGILIISVLVLLTNLSVDMLYTIIDPRIKKE